MKSVTLNDGNSMPIIGFGTYKATEQKGLESVKHALLYGYRLIDTAAVYDNEEAVGKGIKASGVPRKDIFVTTKLWRTSLNYEAAKQEFKNHLKDLI